MTNEPEKFGGPGWLFFAIVLIGIGVGWTLTQQGVMPGVNWTWIAMLAVLATLPVFKSGLNKVTLPISGVLLAAAVASVARQLGYLSVLTELPLLLITGGGLMILSYVLPIRAPEWAGKTSQNPHRGGHAA